MQVFFFREGLGGGKNYRFFVIVQMNQLGRTMGNRLATNRGSVCDQLMLPSSHRDEVVH